MAFLKSFIVQISILVWGTFASVHAQHNSLPVSVSSEGELIYSSDSLGNRVPDYSYCGFQAGSQEIPNIPVVAFVKWQHNDATLQIQEAINYVASLPEDENGYRGTILLDEGIFTLEGRLRVEKSGIVIRGSGINKTVLVAAGKSRETFITITGTKALELEYPVTIKTPYVPVNSFQFELNTKHGLNVGDEILIHRPTTKEWVDKLQMHEFGGEETNYLGWKPGRNTITWDRTITKVNGSLVTIDAPITTATDKNYGGATLSKYTWEGRIENIGFENLSLESTYNQENPKDEDHCWFAITISNAKNAWVRQVDFKHFAGSAVAVYESAKQVTVEDCRSFAPISEIGGQRRYTFFTTGQQILFQRCYAEYGYHDFAVGYLAAGPTAFVQCESHLPYSFSGTIDRWAGGVLFDLVNIDGHKLSLRNRELEAQGAGWTAANSMLWQCSAARIECYSPPTATNWAYGTWGQFFGNGFWHECNSHITPRSLYYAQLTQRLETDVTDRAQFLPNIFGSTSSPTIEMAAELTAKSKEPIVLLNDWIVSANGRNPITTLHSNAKVFSQAVFPQNTSIDKNTIRLSNGWITTHKHVLTGTTLGIQWWRGNTRPDFVSKSTPHITRFVPGRTGTGLTDNIDDVATIMQTNGIVAINHHYGLWYERRRDDHERIRRMNGEVWAPFYEQPFARSGIGSAWDGLSKYDLTKPNYFYWSRLQQFADQADEKGLVLIQQHYFQHNILEAGAHYADFPWRTANNINNTPFPEPPPYAGDKRIFIAEQYYDLSNPHYKALHKQYIEQCLTAFETNENVIQLIGEEFTGPLHFVEFWLDVIGEWEKANHKNVWVGLCVTKDVQDAILNDPKRSLLVDIIDIKYWQLREDGTLYAPKGGKNMAPRQFARQEKTGKPSFESVYTAVSQYRKNYPNKAVLYTNWLDKSQHWAVFMAGGSFAAIPKVEAKGFLEAAATMVSISNDKLYFQLQNAGNESIYYLKDKALIPLKASTKENLKAIWIDPETGKTMKTEKINSNTISNTTGKAVVVWITK